jgi:tyrosine-specific transport protein
MALGYAAISLVVLAIFLPVLMVWKQRNIVNQNQNQSSEKTAELYQVKGGKPALITAAMLGVFIIGSQFMQMLGFVPTIH